MFDIMGQVQEQLASATSLEVFLKILVGIVKELTRFHRVMIYQFDFFFQREVVVTELVDTSQTRDLYKGLHFPATDIPKQASRPVHDQQSTSVVMTEISRRRELSADPRKIWKRRLI